MVIPIACLVSAIIETFPLIGATTSPSDGVRPNPCPIAPLLKIGSLVLLNAITSPLAGARIAISLFSFIVFLLYKAFSLDLAIILNLYIQVVNIFFESDHNIYFIVT